MKASDILNIVTDLPKLFVLQTIQPLRIAMRKTKSKPDTAQQMVDLVNTALKHEIRAGYTHRFMRILFVTVDDRVFLSSLQLR